MRSEQEIRRRLAELRVAYAQTESPVSEGYKLTHVMAIGRMLRDKIELLQ